VLRQSSSLKLRCLRIEPPTITLVTKSLNVTDLLLTCRSIYVEARKVLEPKLKLLRHEPMRYIVHGPKSRSLAHNHVNIWISRRRKTTLRVGKHCHMTGESDLTPQATQANHVRSMFSKLTRLSQRHTEVLRLKYAEQLDTGHTGPPGYFPKGWCDIHELQYRPLLRSITRYATRYRNAYGLSRTDQLTYNLDIVVELIPDICTGTRFSLALLNLLLRDERSITIAMRMASASSQSKQDTACHFRLASWRL
jgi:hypothetical protein